MKRRPIQEHVAEMEALVPSHRKDVAPETGMAKVTHTSFQRCSAEVEEQFQNDSLIDPSYNVESKLWPQESEERLTDQSKCRQQRGLGWHI